MAMLLAQRYPFHQERSLIYFNFISISFISFFIIYNCIYLLPTKI
jgi:hypothetical protein